MATIERPDGCNIEWFVNMLNNRSPTLEEWMRFEEEMHESWIKRDVDE